MPEKSSFDTELMIVDVYTSKDDLLGNGGTMLVAKRRDAASTVR